MNDKIENALKDPNLQGIMNKAASTFTRQLTQDEIYTCKINALWKSLKHWDERKKSKFSTYLFNGVKYECIRELKFKKKNKAIGGKDLDKILASREDHVAEADIIDEIDNLPYAELIKDRSKSFTINEIANRHGMNRESTRRRIKKSAKLLSKRLK
jgi:DNA-directed RNA polymerase specialized sigma24 family protein